MDSTLELCVWWVIWFIEWIHPDWKYQDTIPASIWSLNLCIFIPPCRQSYRLRGIYTLLMQLCLFELATSAEILNNKRHMLCMIMTSVYCALSPRSEISASQGTFNLPLVAGYANTLMFSLKGWKYSILKVAMQLLIFVLGSAMRLPVTYNAPLNNVKHAGQHASGETSWNACPCRTHGHMTCIHCTILKWIDRMSSWFLCCTRCIEPWSWLWAWTHMLIGLRQ